MDAITQNTCYLSTRKISNFNGSGFTLPKFYLHGTYDGIDFVTNGNIGRPCFYLRTDNGYRDRTQDALNMGLMDFIQKRKSRARRDETGRVISKARLYVDIIAEKNNQYKGSMRQVVDRISDTDAITMRKMDMRKSIYNPIYTDSGYRAYVTSRQERNIGLNAS